MDLVRSLDRPLLGGRLPARGGFVEGEKGWTGGPESGLDFDFDFDSGRSDPVPV